MEENKTNEDWVRDQLKMAMEELSSKSIGERARDQVVRTLSKMHCSCEQITADNMSFYFEGGGMFLQHFQNSPIVKLYYCFPTVIPLDDPEMVEKAKRLVNDFNKNITSCMSYYIFEEFNYLSVEIAHHFRVLLPRTPQLEEYLISIFRDFFSICHKFESKMFEDSVS